MKSKGKIIKLIAVIAALAIVIAGYVICSNSDDARVREQLDLGEKYLADQDYEQAIIAYETVIEIEPMNVEAYLGLADAYVGKGDYETAKSVLQKGYDLTEDEAIKNKRDEVNANIEKIKMEEETARLEAEKERKRLEMDKNTPEYVKELYEMMDSATDDEIVAFCMENNLMEYSGSYNPTGDKENGIVLDVYNVEAWKEYWTSIGRYENEDQMFSIYYGEKTNGSYETNGKWYIIYGKAEHLDSRFNYDVYDGEWKGGKPNGVGKMIQIGENHGTARRDNGVIICEGYAMQKWITHGIFINGYVSGDYEEIYEFDIDNILPWPEKDIREYRGVADQKGKIIEEYIKRDGEWQKINNSAFSAGWVEGFSEAGKDFNWCSYLQRGED